MVDCPAGACSVRFIVLQVQQAILTTLKDTSDSWMLDVIAAFQEGKLELFDAAMSKHKAQIANTPVRLKGCWVVGESV